MLLVMLFSKYKEIMFESLPIFISIFFILYWYGFCLSICVYVQCVHLFFGMFISRKPIKDFITNIMNYLRV